MYLDWIDFTTSAKIEYLHRYLPISIKRINKFGVGTKIKVKVTVNDFNLKFRFGYTYINIHLLMFVLMSFYLERF